MGFVPPAGSAVELTIAPPFFTGQTASDELLAAYQKWGGNIDPVYSEYAY